MRRSERPFFELPRLLLVGFVFALLFQLAFHHSAKTAIDSEYQELMPPWNAGVYNGLAMGSEQLIGYLLAIKLQLHDTQLGRYFSYGKINYRRLVDWLQLISRVNPESEYPALLAARVYSQTGNADQLRLVLGFIEAAFDLHPQLHWRRMAEASVIARHQLGDLPMALRIAEKLATQPASVIMPHWARDLRILLLAELDQHQTAIVIIEAMLASNSINDPDEKRFLQEKLSNFQQKLFETQHNRID